MMVSRPFSGSSRPNVETSTESCRKPWLERNAARASADGASNAAGGRPGYRIWMVSARAAGRDGPLTSSMVARNRLAT
jgi:hypothetical protein